MLFGETNMSAGSNTASIAESFNNPNEICEMFIVDEVSQLPTEKIQEFCKPGGVGEQLVTEGKLRKNTLIRLNKQDDLTRRTKMMALQIAKEKNDPLWTKLKKNRVQERMLLQKIMKKYGREAQRLAKEGQREWLHSPAPALPKSFQKAGGEDR